MRHFRCVQAALVICLVGGNWAAQAQAGDAKVAKPIDHRFRDGNTDETPDFQRHVIPLFGRLGCNGRACHGSFQGKGGFRLSLFGYDFKGDHEALLNEDNPRVDVDDADFSLIISKPTDSGDHEGGQRYEKDSWQYHVLHRWIEKGASYDNENKHKLVSLDVEPAEIVFSKSGENVQLKAVAIWADGTREDVTPLCRFRTNNGEVATVDEAGVVAAAEPGDTHVVVFYDNGVTPIPVLQPISSGTVNQYPQVPTPTPIDEAVVAKLRKLGIVPSELSGDAEFLRRISLDLTGTLPTPDEVKAFLADKSDDKRSRKIDELLETPAYVAWWTTRLCDFTGNNDTQLNNALPTRNRSASREWYDWIYQRVDQNVPYDQLVAGILLGQSREPGESYTDYCQAMSEMCRKGSDSSLADRQSMPFYWARRDFREPEARAIGVAYSFLGVRIQCAQCHKHPFDQWTKEDFVSFQSFFDGVVSSNRARRDDQAEYNRMLADLGLKGKASGQLRRDFQRLLDEGKTVPFPEVYVASTPARNRNARNRNKNAGAKKRLAKIPGGQVVDLAKYKDPREALMEWMRDDANPYFSKAFANRVWANYFNIGIVSPADDMSLANPPSNQALLDYLAKGFRESGFDMKWLHREIANSRTYQMSWRPNDTNLQDERNFSRAVPRRLPAEVVYDAVRQATSSDKQLAAMRTSLEGRAIAVPGTTPRGSRDGDPRFALSVFGRSSRESNCDCDRSEEPNLLQTVYLQNDRDIQNMLNRKDGWLAEIAGGVEAEPNGKGRPPKYAEMVRNAERRIRSLRKQGKKEQANQLQQRLVQLRKRSQVDQPQQDERQAADVPQRNVDQLISSAYLRTLSREPQQDEIEIARQYVQDAKNPPTGMRDILWALINTKEFIVNH